MILKDYECQVCGEITEDLVDSKNVPDQIICPICNGYADKILTISQTHPVDAAWIGTVLEVVDKESTKPHCREFVTHPTRANLKNWMKGEGLRPLEPGEATVPKVDDKQKRAEIKKGMLERYRERNAVSIST